MSKRYTSYSEKLRDPRWQKCRLKVLERDDFTCKKCGDKESTLHVHHKIYPDGLEPWDYEYKLLITLCEDCHQEEEECKQYEKRFLHSFYRAGFFSGDLYALADAFFNYKIKVASEVDMSAIQHLLQNPEEMEVMISKMFESIHPKKGVENVL